MVTKTTQLKSLIAQGHFESVTHFMVWSMIHRLFPSQGTKPVRKVVFSLALGLLFILLILIGLAGNYLFGRVQVTSQVLSIILLGIVYIYFLCIAIEFQIGEFTKIVKEHILDALIREADRQSLQRSMETIFSLRRQFWFGFLFSLFVHLTLLSLTPVLSGNLALVY